ncbi:hypothetical protein SSX86_005158 [Deinandra increscens subsp. villosa]|uniref:Protein kinase domain-containing protein n=1 Tax=Deinandra increscens subsp. villosa TaxID=3103831 RepID=A0AAP0DTB4_9ASTR
MEIRVPGESLVETEDTRAVMDSPNSVSRLKFLVSFNGSILPRPQDGKLRYVGGETRIVSVTRDIGFEQLMEKMTKLFDGATVLKYQQPDEDLDALVSVVNDDDVTNMMEEYEKLGSGDGFTRLRIFLFSSNEQDDSMHFVDRDEIDNERRYVDALNSHNDSPVDDVQSIDQYYNQLNLDGSVNNQRNFELQHVRIPHQQSLSQRYSEMESPWSPAYFSPRNHGNDFPNSPSSSRYHTPYGDPGDKSFDRVYPEDYFRQQNVVHQPQYDQQLPFPENVAGFPGNILHGSHQVNNPYAECPPAPFYNNMNINLGHTAYPDGNHVTSHYVHHVIGNEIFHDQAMATGFHNGYGPTNALWRNGQSQMQENGAYNLGYVRTTMESTPNVEIPSQHHLPTEPVQFMPAPVHFMAEPVQLTPDPVPITPEPIQHTLDPVQFSHEQIQSTSERVQFTPGLPNCLIPVDPVNTLNTEVRNNSSSTKDGFGNEKLNSSAKQVIVAEKSGQENGYALQKEETINESVKNADLEGADDVKDEAKEKAASAAVNDLIVKEETVQELDTVDAPADVELDSDNDIQINTKIEPTKAEEEAIARGLQTIKNDDLEEVRELGSGTYGAVYHGKWKGSDVAIKRIKASCFAGRPSERERLIADFWKEALILSSLHHPNVVSFYGIVRDGPDGSLATVTEFMVNGSLKQFLQKKDRTIDRRKRLIIAMDASFGMEYLHGKNIVHFDLKCENLLVNMRDPHRPICKIGDLGLSKVKQHTLVSGGVRGTLPWMAPELLSGKNHMVSEKIDVYSFGIVMWELLTGDEPYGDMHCASIIGGIVNNSLRPTIPTWCDPEWKALMGSCWSADPSERPSFSEISQKLRNMAAAINVK